MTYIYDIWPILLALILFIIRYCHYYPFARILFYHKDNEISRFSGYFKLLPFFTSLAISCSLFYFLSPSPFAIVLLFLLSLSSYLFDKYIFWHTAFYGLEDILFASTQLGLIVYFIDSYFFNLSSGLSFILISTILSSIFLNAGFDKLKSTDWKTGQGFLIFASIPTYRLFTLNSFAYNLLRRISPLLSKFEIFHQCGLPIFALVGIIFGLKLPLFMFLVISLFFMVTLIYPFCLTSISTYGFISCLLSLSSLSFSTFNSQTSILYSLCFFVFVFGVNSFGSTFNMGHILRLSTGLLKCGLFTEYHLHGLVFLSPGQPHSFLSFDSHTSGAKLSRIFYNNQGWLNILRFLDVLERAKYGVSVSSDYLFLKELHHLFTSPNSIEECTIYLRQLDWDYHNNRFTSQPFTFTLYNNLDSIKSNLITNSQILPFNTMRNVQHSSYEPGFSKSNIYRGHQ